MSANIKAFQEEVQGKIKQILAEFGAGQISNEQFNILYERYNNQLELAITAGEDEARHAASANGSTIAIRAATTGKAVGMGIYHHRSGTMVETLGSFELGPKVTSSTLNEFSDKLARREFIEPVTRQLAEGFWVVFMARSYTTAIVVFRNEPAQRQVRALERLLHDFEEANERLLDTNQVNSSKLARPFIGFVRKRLAS